MLHPYIKHNVLFTYILITILKCKHTHIGEKQSIRIKQQGI